MISGVNGLNLNFDFSGARRQHLKTHEEKEANIMELLRKFSKMCLNLKA